MSPALALALSAAVATVSPTPPAGAAPDERPSQSPAERLRTLALLLRSDKILRTAGEDAGSPLLPADVEAQIVGDAIRVRVDGEGVQAANARCRALLRATATELHGAPSTLPWLLDEWRTLRQRLASIELRLSRAKASGMDTDDPRTALLSARLALRRLDETDRTNAQPWRLQTLLDQAAELDRRRLELGATFRDEHPTMMDLRGRLGVLRDQIEAQREAERSYLSALVAGLDKLPARSGADALHHARLAAQAAQLAHADPQGCALASDGPAALLTRADACDAAHAELATLSVRYGERHPKVIAAAARLDEARREFAIERRAIVAVDEVQARAPVAGSGGEHARDEREADALRRMLVMLGDRLAQAAADAPAAPRLQIVEGCATPR